MLNASHSSQARAQHVGSISEYVDARFKAKNAKKIGAEYLALQIQLNFVLLSQGVILQGILIAVHEDEVVGEKLGTLLLLTEIVHEYLG